MKSRYTRRLLESIASGAASGAAGTLALHMTHEASYRYAPHTLPPMLCEPGHYMVDKAEALLPRRTRNQVTTAERDTAASALSFAYGALWPAIYLTLRGRHTSVLVDGVALGVAVWGIGYLGWLPGLRLSPPVQQQTATQVVNNVAQHALYGVVTVAAWRGIRSLLD
ncbi:MAG TPA: hypothetical protein VFA04_18830 [Bryobacteraceae bacterium]|nr:hypothetical protein [Bryobacteraceae bacterium]